MRDCVCLRMCLMQTEIFPLEIPFKSQRLHLVFCSTRHRFSGFELALHNGPIVSVCVLKSVTYFHQHLFSESGVRICFFKLFLLFSCESEGQTVVKRQTTLLAGGGGGGRTSVPISTHNFPRLTRK
jgi:hypothetical protein